MRERKESLNERKRKRKIERNAKKLKSVGEKMKIEDVKKLPRERESQKMIDESGKKMLE